MPIDETLKSDWTQGMPALRDFAADAEAVFDPADSATVFDCRSLLERLLLSDWLDALVTHELDMLARWPGRQIGGGSETHMPLFNSRHLALSLLLFTPEEGRTPRKLVGSPRNALLGVWGPAALELHRFFQPRPFPADQLDRSRRLEDRGLHLVQPAESTAIVAGHDVVTIRAEAGPVVVLSLEPQETARLRWRYDESTHLPVAMVTSTSLASRLEFAAGVLARLGDRRCTPVLQRMFWHDDHLVRWAAVRSLMRLDRAAGLELLETARQDPHPHVRRAAQVATERMYPAGTSPLKAA